MVNLEKSDNAIRINMDKLIDDTLDEIGYANNDNAFADDALRPFSKRAPKFSKRAPKPGNSIEQQSRLADTKRLENKLAEQKSEQSALMEAMRGEFEQREQTMALALEEQLKYI